MANTLCPTCKGSKFAWDCPTCHGTGQVPSPEKPKTDLWCMEADCNCPCLNCRQYEHDRCYLARKQSAKPTDTSTDWGKHIDKGTGATHHAADDCDPSNTPDQPQADEPNTEFYDKIVQKLYSWDVAAHESTCASQMGDDVCDCLPEWNLENDQMYDFIRYVAEQNNKLIAQAKIGVLEQLKEIQAEAWDDATHCTCLPFAIEEIEATIKGE